MHRSSRFSIAKSWHSRTRLRMSSHPTKRWNTYGNSSTSHGRRVGNWCWSAERIWICALHSTRASDSKDFIVRRHRRACVLRRPACVLRRPACVLERQPACVLEPRPDLNVLASCQHSAQDVGERKRHLTLNLTCHLSLFPFHFSEPLPPNLPYSTIITSPFPLEEPETHRVLPKLQPSLCKLPTVELRQVDAALKLCCKFSCIGCL